MRPNNHRTNHLHHTNNTLQQSRNNNLEPDQSLHTWHSVTLLPNTSEVQHKTICRQSLDISYSVSQLLSISKIRDKTMGRHIVRAMRSIRMMIGWTDIEGGVGVEGGEGDIKD